MPAVSILMPVYNAERYLDEAIRSIIGQTYRDFEFLIVNDASTDRSVSVIRSFTDSRIRVLENTQNLGVPRSLNRALSEATGKYIVRMDADDTALADRIRLQVEFMDAHPLIGVVGTQTVLVDSDGKEIGSESYPCSPAEIRKIIFRRNPLAHPTVCIRAEALAICGRYDERFLHNEDYDLWLRIGARFSLANLGSVQLRRRVHHGNISVIHQTEMTLFRYRTLAHAITEYYRQPFLRFHLVRPFAAYMYRRWIAGGLR